MKKLYTLFVMANTKIDGETYNRMKTTLLFSILMCPAFLFGQIVNHFDNPDSKWNVAKTYPAANQQNPNFAATTTTVYGFQGDTIVNSQQWFKLFSTSDSLFQNNLVYRGLIRTENNRVLHLDTLNQLDTLYDFNLNPGDSVLFNLYGTIPEWLQIINIDSIPLNGQYYKRYKFEEPSITAFDWLNEIWIEGIGSIHGPLFPTFPFKFSEEFPDSMLLTCTFSDNQLIWQHPFYSDCYINIVLGLEEIEILNYNIFPNPTNGNFNVIYLLPQNKEGKLEVFDITGKVVYDMNLPQWSTLQQISLPSYISNGLYNCVITGGGQRVSRKIAVIYP